MSDCTECGWPVATDADNDRPCDDHCDHCRGLCWHEFTGVHRDDVRPDATIATLTHRAEVAEARLAEISDVVTHEHYNNFAAMVAAYRSERDSASLWRERCNKAEARVAAYQREIHRIACGEQVEGDGLCPDGIALAAAQDAYEAAGYEAFQCANERDAARFLAAGWRRLARHYQSCHLAGHACLRETHRAKGEQVAALRRARDDDAAYRSDLMEQCDALRAKLARAEGVVAAARAVAREHDRYLSDEVGPMGHVDEACDALRAALATYEEG